MARGKSKTIRYTMRSKRGEGVYRLNGDYGGPYVCGAALWCLFEIDQRKPCDIVVSTTRPRGNNFQILRRNKDSETGTYLNTWRVVDAEGATHYPMADANARLNEDFPNSKRLYVSLYA